MLSAVALTTPVQPHPRGLWASPCRHPRLSLSQRLHSRLRRHQLSYLPLHRRTWMYLYQSPRQCRWWWSRWRCRHRGEGAHGTVLQEGGNELRGRLTRRQWRLWTRSLWAEHQVNLPRFCGRISFRRWSTYSRLRWIQCSDVPVLHCVAHTFSHECTMR